MARFQRTDMVEKEDVFTTQKPVNSIFSMCQEVKIIMFPSTTR